MWNVQGGDWDKLPVTLSENRDGSSDWAHGDQLVIMGGAWDAAMKSSETVSSDGSDTSSSFPMKYTTR